MTSQWGPTKTAKAVGVAPSTVSKIKAADVAASAD